MNHKMIRVSEVYNDEVGQLIDTIPLSNTSNFDELKGKIRGYCDRARMHAIDDVTKILILKGKVRIGSGSSLKGFKFEIVDI